MIEPAADAPAPSEPAEKRVAARPPEPEGGVKDTVESILVAFILAFIFRAFVVEAFVIPTGSMAPTLLGAHMRFRCDDCGYEFTANFSSNNSKGDDIDIPQNSGTSYSIRCPNCGYLLPKSGSRDAAFSPAVHYGDRILVLKYLYLFNQPRRWDVVVFKSPVDPKQHDYTQNFIKRLVGKPNESVMILDGDVYVGSSTAPATSMVIQTKPRDVQEALWRIVYDNDYHPHGLARDAYSAGWEQPWKSTHGAGWNTNDDAADPATRRVVTFDNANGRADLNFDPSVNAKTSPAPTWNSFTDWVVYDFLTGTWENNIVGDLKLEMSYQRESGDGPLRLNLAKHGRTFTAEIGNGTARLLSTANGQESQIALPVKAFDADSGPLRIEFTNVDYQVTLRINGEVILQTDPKDYAPDISELLKTRSHSSDAHPHAWISAERQKCEITHLRLWRDVYYYGEGRKAMTNKDGLRSDDGPFWGNPDNIIRLGADEYFVLGDNTQISSDARYWAHDMAIDLPYEQLKVDSGRVPGRFMLGKAFFVYWPAGFRPFESSPAIAPNFGEMRFIH